ncbi:ABC transporter substrate-binding protein [Deinococcus malanensis]|uniref:ABC transporter substrate-binding protein n=1 Tax=Deinococcus malanensis TaxID=1706855 RepID=A0ABQ2EVY1_9DEIO|nr:ABC transporter substrate-binding protein [Deinococcus malanensis]GGK29138.1 ABC transporter substrate-binding protein [Deinococcus malanensis]
MNKVLILTLSGLALSSQAAATRYPLTLTDDLNRKVTIGAEPMRIVSVLPSTTETLCALGVCNRLVGVDTFSDYPQQVTRLPKVGGLYDPNIEAIVALKPDLVVVSKYGKLEGPLTQAGITVVAVNPETYEEVFSKTLTLGRIVNREAAAKALVTQMRRDIARVEILTKNAVRKPTTYLEIDPTPYSVGPNSFMGVLLTKAGARNIIPASMGDFPKVDPEFIVKQNPQLILGTGLKDLGKRPGWNSIAAVRTGRVVEIPAALNTMLGRPGPRLAEALRGLARIIHPQLVK